MTNLSNRSLIIVLILSIIAVIMSALYKRNDNVTTVFNELDYNKTYIIDLEGCGITTKNIGDYFDNDIIAIYPSTGKKYQNVTNYGWYYIDKTISMDKNIDYLNKYIGEYPFDVLEQVEINIKYEGYIKKAQSEAQKLVDLDNKKIPIDINYDNIHNLASEAKQKLKQIKPTSIGQAMRISGVNPVDISLLMVYIKKEYFHESK